MCTGSQEPPLVVWGFRLKKKLIYYQIFLIKYHFNKHGKYICFQLQKDKILQSRHLYWVLLQLYRITRSQLLPSLYTHFWVSAQSGVKCLASCLWFLAAVFELKVWLTIISLWQKLDYLGYEKVLYAVLW